MLSDEQIIKRCIRNDREAQKMLYDRYGRILLGVCYRYAKDLEEAEDILQEGLIKVYLHIHEYSGAGSFISWMKAIMVNTAITNYHRTKKHLYHLDIEEVRESEMEGAEFDSSEFTREELLGVIHSLPEGYRIVFNMYAVEGYKHKEIAEMLGIDINTSKSQYSRARRLIRQKLEQISRAAKKKDDRQ
jgi:RNA polymerase sigma factor (sigma-70 family)